MHLLVKSSLDFYLDSLEVESYTCRKKADSFLYKICELEKKLVVLCTCSYKGESRDTALATEGNDMGNVCPVTIGTEDAYAGKILEDCLLVTSLHDIYRGYYTVTRRYEFYFLVAKTIVYERAQRVSKIFKPPCNVLFII